jgi:transposase-like protein
MDKSITPLQLAPSASELHELLRVRVVEAIEIVLEEELAAALGSARYERLEARRGYRNGAEPRAVTTEYGAVDLKVPRGRLFQPDGSTREFQSAVLPKYQRRTRKVDEALLGCYLAGGNTRRIRKALAPLLGEANLSKSSISRVVTRIKKLFSQWCERDLSEESYPILFLDGIHLKVRLVRRVVSVPVLVALGVDEQGSKRLVSLKLLGHESGPTWEALVEDLKRRALAEPALIVSDGHKGVTKAAELWTNAKLQRCVVHKLHNLLKYCPSHAHPELKRDYNRIVYAEEKKTAEKEHEKFLKKWRPLCAQVATSLEEAGDKLLSFYDFPEEMWKSIRSTNAIENLNREFRRRTKTQGSFTNEASALTLLWALVAFDQIQFRKIDGYTHVQTLRPVSITEGRAA